MPRDTKHLQAESVVYRGSCGTTDIYDITITVSELQAQRMRRLLRDSHSSPIIGFQPENKYRSLLYMLAGIPVVQKLLLKGLVNISNGWYRKKEGMHTRTWPYCVWDESPDSFSVDNEEDRVLACLLLGRHNTGTVCLRILKS